MNDSDLGFGCSLAIFFLIIAIVVNIFIGLWLHGNTQDLATHYMKEQIVLPKWPFILGSCLTEVIGLPAAIITEVWSMVVIRRRKSEQ